MPKRLLLVDPLFHPKGGGPAVTYWALEALKGAYDVTLLAWGDARLEEGNRLSGTSLQPGEIRVVNPPIPVRWVGELLNAVDRDPWSIQRWALLMRTARILATQFDIVITTNGEACFGTPAMQYVHYPYLADGMSRPKPGGSFRRPWERTSGFTWSGMAANYAMANSDWTGERYRAFYGARAQTLYPPVPGPVCERPSAERENGFVAVGRFSGDKRLEMIIDVLAVVREHHPDLHLHLVGVRMPEEAGGAEYYQRLRRRVDQHPDWVFLEEGLPREALYKLLGQHRYGIHAKQEEHFGIAVAEMVRAGCITFTHRSGGQVEIVADDRLLFASEADAVAKILAVIGQPGLRQELQQHMFCQAERFSAQRFMRELREHVAVFVEARS